MKTHKTINIYGNISKLRNAKFVVFRDPTHPVIKVMQNSNIFTDPLPRNE